MNHKKLYSFHITRKETVIETKTEGSSTISTPVEKDVEIEVYLKKPTPRDQSNAESQRKKSFGKYVKEGYILKTSLKNSYENCGGVLSESEHKKWVDCQNTMQRLSKRVLELQKEFDISDEDFDKIDKEPESEIAQKYPEIASILNEIQTNSEFVRSIEQQNVSLFNATAEHSAFNDAVEKTMFDCSYIVEKNGAKGVFPNGNYNEQREKTDILLEDGDEEFTQLYERLLFLWTVHFYGANTDEQLKRADAMFLSNRQ